MHMWQNYYTEKMTRGQNKTKMVFIPVEKWGKRFPDNASYFSFSVPGKLFFMMFSHFIFHHRDPGILNALFLFTLCFWVAFAVALTHRCYLLTLAAFFRDSFLAQMWKVQWCYPPLPSLSPVLSASTGSLRQLVRPLLTSCALPLTGKWWWDSKTTTETIQREVES